MTTLMVTVLDDSPDELVTITLYSPVISIVSDMVNDVAVTVPRAEPLMRYTVPLGSVRDTDSPCAK